MFKSKSLQSLFLIALGSLIYAIAINYFLIPTKLGEGGVTGLTTIAYYTLKIPPYLTNFILNGFLLLVGYRFLDRRTIIRSIWAVIWLSIFLKIPVFYTYHTTETIIPTLAGGVLTGVAMGLILNAGGSIAGSTILGRIFNKYFGMQIGSATLFFDLAVAIPSVLIIGFQNMLLTVLELYLSAQLTNVFLSRFGSKKSINIISNQTNLIAQKLSAELHQGITLIKASGYYSQTERPIIYLICSSKQLAEIIPLIREIDPQALIVVDNIRSVRAEELYRLL
ncbi:MAG: YitT family protein [Liquorilactobacillus nagelii]|nr:YitT family protein [Liquorilactobacillus nagelii]MCC7615259.1 membrane protein [Liquorilactobacillus nagelii]MCI1632593.1 YitT family protein [Liquorilactobacillus nagelii]MCP9315492.1 YitT family protein [Liquorilactobacillus nagelii]QYH53948.1 YitT family protein [Liquorilactobacillus nagelii DSM 13675]ULQ49571.1 YitT family protein [Liquorilactobacillus nagelii]